MIRRNRSVATPAERTTDRQGPTAACSSATADTTPMPTIRAAIPNCLEFLEKAQGLAERKSANLTSAVVRPWSRYPQLWPRISCLLASYVHHHPLESTLSGGEHGGDGWESKSTN